MSILCVALILNIGAICLRKKTGVSGAVMHMLLLFVCLDIMYFFSMFNMLRPSVWLGFAAILAASAFAAVKDRKNIVQTTKDFFDIGIVFNTVSSLAFFAIYAIRQPLLYYWDELRLWGPMAAFVKSYDRLYTIGINVLDTREYPCGSAILNYLYTFFDKEFYDSGMLAAYTFMFIAVFSRVSSMVAEKTGKKSLATGLFLFLLLSPFTTLYHTITNSYSSISYAYSTSMVDFNLAVVFLAVIAIYIYRPDRKFFVRPLIHLITIKKSGIFFALLAVCVIAAFELFSERWNMEKLKRAAVTLAVAAIAVRLTYGGWSMHRSHYYLPKTESEYDLRSIPVRQEDIREKEDDTSRGSVGRGETSVKAIFIPSLRTRRYREILEEMKQYFLYNTETIFSRDVHLALFLLAVGLITAVFARKGLRIPIALVSLGLAAGCFVYILVISYQMQFYHDMMVEYPRYMVSYYYGWIYVIVLLLCMLADRLSVLSEILLLAVNLFSLRFVFFTKGLDRTFIEAPDNVYRYQEEINERLAPIRKELDRGDRVLLVFPGVDGSMYNTVKFRLMPAITGVDMNNTGIDFSIGFRSLPDSEIRYNIADAELYEIIVNEYFDYVLVSEADVQYAQDYGALFENGVHAWTLYRVDGSRLFKEVVR